MTSSPLFLVSSLPADGRIQIVDGQGRIFVSKDKPSLVSVKAGLARGFRPETSAKWSFVRFVKTSWEAEECKGCEFCDGEGGHSKSDSRRLYEQIYEQNA
jgi:hypothetical protein